MANFRRMAWCAAAALAVSGTPLLAQQQGGTIGVPTTQTITTANGISQTTSSNTSGGSGIPGASSSISDGQQAQQQFQLATVNQPPSMTQTNNTAINTSNFLRNTYGSVLYQGSDRSQVPNRIPGGFGTAVYTTTGTAAGGRGQQGAAAPGARGGATLTDPGGQIVTLPRQIAYTSQIQFKTPAGNPVPQLQSDLRTSIDRVPKDLLANPAGVQVAVDGRNVTLKGSVRDEEEARLVEGMVRLTPGVFDIKNELTVAK